MCVTDSANAAVRIVDGFSATAKTPTPGTETAGTQTPGTPLIRLWDFQVGHRGCGFLASAVSGAATVIGVPGQPAVGLPAHIPEKWCGIYGAVLALAELWRGDSVDLIYDVSAADTLRAFALQNSGSPEERKRLWRRNGRIPVEHGGIFPMGFFACKDGYVALLGRSRRDWRNIREALDNPDWAMSGVYSDPFVIAKNSTRADALLEQTLQSFSRDDLLARGLAHNAVIAPVFTHDEALQRQIFRAEFAQVNGPAMPFVVTPHPQPGKQQLPGEQRRWKQQNAASARSRALPLLGLRCLELCWIWSGPLVGQTLADLGAEVIKIESRGRFDLYRTRGLEHLRGQMPEQTRLESSIYFHSLNRNKVGISVDLKSPAGIEVVKSLIAKSDLLIDNFTVGTLDKLGLSADAMRAVNPDLVVLSMSGPGQHSALAALRSYGLVLSALAGAEACIECDGEFVGSPTYSISDPNAALFATLGALAGTIGARRTGGMRIDVSQIEAAGTLIGVNDEPRDAVTNQVVFSREGEELALSVPNGGSLSPQAVLRELEGMSVAQIRDFCAAARISIAPVLALEDTDNAPVFNGCSGWLDAVHPTTGAEHLVAAPWRIDGNRPALRKPAPRLGEDNDYILRDVLGFDATHIQRLKDSEIF